MRNAQKDRFSVALFIAALGFAGCGGNDSVAGDLPNALSACEAFCKVAVDCEFLNSDDNSCETECEADIAVQDEKKFEPDRSLSAAEALARLKKFKKRDPREDG